jgi:hypothetical protein
MDHEYQHGPGASKGHGDLWRMSNPENEPFFISDILSLLIARAMDGVAGQCVLGLNQYKLQASVQLPANSTQQLYPHELLSHTPVTAVASLVLLLSIIPTLLEHLRLSHLFISYSFIVAALETTVCGMVYLFFFPKQLYMQIFNVMNWSGSRFLVSQAP